MAELVSILIPAYNAEPYLAETLESALAQTWPHTEIIVVDDGSTDATLAVAERFRARGVGVLAQPNRGAGAARNAALRLARGDYIQWLDADDLLAPDKIERQLRDGGGAGWGRVLRSSAFGEFFVRPERSRFRPTALWADQAPVDFLLERFNHNLWMSCGAWLVPRALADAAGPWDERLSLNDDGEYVARLLAHADHIRFSAEARSFYRRGNAGSLSRTVSDRASESLLLSLRLCIGHLRTLEDSERTRRAGVTLLQTWLDYFYPDRPHLYARASDLAQELGGSLTPPVLSWKYRPIETLFGWGAVRRTMAAVAGLKIEARTRTDRFLSALARTRAPS